MWNLTGSIRWVALLLLCSSVVPVRGQSTTTPSSATAAAEDRRRMMQTLHIPEPGPLPLAADDPKRPQNTRPTGRGNNYTDDARNTYVRSSWGNWSNYDQDKANPYPLPDPLLLKNGQRVTDAQMWWDKRRPEILDDFLTEIYGRIPAETPKVTWEVVSTEPTPNGAAVHKTVMGHIDNSRYPAAKPSVNINMFLPAAAHGPVPMMVVVGPGFGGGILGRGPTTQAARRGGVARGPAPGPSARDQLLAIGWGYATVATNAIQADSGAGLSQGIIGLVSEGRPRKPDDWGVLTAWAWGLTRAMDYFETDKSVDARQIGIEGHSRWGKEALWSAAIDQRWAIVYCSCSGEAGAKLSRRDWGETVDNVAGSGEYHWMAGNFLKYGGHWNQMPVDAHELIALVAPRPIFITGGTQDQWSDPRGEFLAAAGADPVYRLLGKKGLGTTEMPAPDVALVDGELAYRDHKGGHTDALDWPVFLQFAQRYLHAPAR